MLQLIKEGNNMFLLKDTVIYHVLFLLVFK